MASVSPMNVVLPSRLVAYLISFLPLYLPALSTFLPHTDIGLLQVSPLYLILPQADIGQQHFNPLHLPPTD